MKKIIFVFHFLLISGSLSLFSQSQQRQIPDGMKFFLRGSIVESSENQPIEYASIALYSQRDSSMAGGTITDALGNFEIELQRPGKFSMVVQFIGYEKYTLNGVMVNPQSPSVTLKPIVLSPSAIMLQEATVTDRRNEIIYKIDKKVIQVAGNANAVGNTAVEVLENTPGFEVDDEGNVQLRGSENFTVLINGKPTVLSGNDALKQIPASSIENIEVITNPSARYDPDGLTGIINVVLKRDDKGGLNGLIDISVGNRDRYNASINLNYRKSIHSVTVGYDYNQMSRGGISHAERNTFRLTDTISRTEDGTRQRRNLGQNVRLGYDLDFTKRTSFSINGLMRLGNSKSYYENNQLINYSSLPTVQHQLTKTEENGSRDNYDINSTFLHKFDNEGHELQIMGTMSGNRDDQRKRNYREMVPWLNVAEWFDSTWTKELYQTIQADYVKPLGLVKLETGLRSRFRQIDFENRNSQNPYTQISTGKNHFLYDDGIHAFYLMGSSKIEKWEFQLGLRTEYYRIETFQESNNQKNVKEDVNFFPTLHISNSIGNNKIMAGYSRRVNRPNIRFINPYEEFDDTYNVSRGNPELDPEFSNAIEINYLRYFGQSTASATLFYRQTDNAISRVRRLYNPLDDNGVMLNTFENMNKQASLGLEASIRHSLTKWFQIDGNYSFFQYSIEGQTNNQPVNTSSINHSFRTNLVFRIGKNITLSTNAMYNSPSVTAQGKRGAFFNNGISYRHQVLDRRGTITLSARNPVGKFRWEFESSGQGFDDYFYRQPYMPMLTAGFSYRLNEGIKRKRSSNGERTEDFSSEMEM
jgi:outer membrane receptor protein involved in Fe transport